MNYCPRFLAPTPKPWLMNLLAPVTEVFFLKGLPFLRDLPLIKTVPGVCGLAKVRYIDFPLQDQQNLKDMTGKNRATFFLPNHPEFFTDWMIDKYVLSRISRKAACWADGRIVNGMGRLMQRFWLNNNLIAQISGQSRQGKRYSVTAALAGQGVLLHPEGQVNWFGNIISDVFPGAAEMAIKSYLKGSSVTNAGFQCWLAPIVWKLRFNADVKSNLLDECRYIENRLELESSRCNCPARRTYTIYHQLASRDYCEISCTDNSFAHIHLGVLRNKIVEKSCEQLADVISLEQNDHLSIIRTATKWLGRHNAAHACYSLVKRACRIVKRWIKLNIRAFRHSTISQEEIAEHQKRIRADFCNGRIRDKINQLIPQAAGVRTAHIRAVNPLAIHELPLSNNKPDPAQIMEKVRQSMQQKLNQLIDELELKSPGLKIPNPFYLEKPGG